MKARDVMALTGARSGDAVLLALVSGKSGVDQPRSVRSKLVHFEQEGAIEFRDDGGWYLTAVGERRVRALRAAARMAVRKGVA